MFFTASKVVWFLAAPSHLLILAAALGCLVGGFTPWRGAGFGVAFLCLAGLALAGLSPLAAWVTRPLEDRLPSFEDDGRPVTGILVLGGAVEARSSASRGQIVTNDAGERMIALGDLARRYPEAKLVFVGGSGSLKGGESEAGAVRRYIGTLGVPPERMLYEEQSRNTRENATLSAAMLSPGPGERWLLVTSAWHMPRSVGCFRQAGFTVTAYPVDYRTGRGYAAQYATISEGLFELDIAAREWVGLLAYRLAGYTDALVPGPEP
ncbi:MAG: YdcF family protein [Methylobacterium frigidaeris]